jgi:hypothetical protein
MSSDTQVDDSRLRIGVHLEVIWTQDKKWWACSVADYRLRPSGYEYLLKYPEDNSTEWVNLNSTGGGSGKQNGSTALQWRLADCEKLESKRLPVRRNPSRTKRMALVQSSAAAEGDEPAQLKKGMPVAVSFEMSEGAGDRLKWFPGKGKVAVSCLVLTVVPENTVSKDNEDGTYDISFQDGTGTQCGIGRERILTLQEMDEEEKKLRRAGQADRIRQRIQREQEQEARQQGQTADSEPGSAECVPKEIPELAGAHVDPSDNKSDGSSDEADRHAAVENEEPEQSSEDMIGQITEINDKLIYWAKEDETPKQVSEYEVVVNLLYMLSSCTTKVPVKTSHHTI